jgi:hypothetical protein
VAGAVGISHAEKRNSQDLWNLGVTIAPPSPGRRSSDYRPSRKAPGRPDGARRAGYLGGGGLPEDPSLLPGVDQGVPDELTPIVTHRRVPRVSAMPDQFHGRHVVVVGTCYAEPVEEGKGF